MKKDLKLGDLQFADILTLRNGQRYVVADNYMHGYVDDQDIDGAYISDYYNDNLTANSRHDSESDIVKVERCGQVIYDRSNQPKEMTLSEICKELGYDVKIVRRLENE